MKTVILSYACAFFFWVALYVPIPLIPVYALSLPGANLDLVGWITFSYALALILLRVPLGLLSDRWGNRKIFMLMGFFAIIIGFLGLALAPNTKIFLAARLITGIGATTWVVHTVLFSSYFPPERTAHVMGRITLFMGLSPMLLGMPGGYLADRYGIPAVFYGAAIFGLLGLIAAKGIQEQPSPKGGFFLSKDIFSPLLLQTAAATAVFVLVVFTVSFGFFPVYAERLGASKFELGSMNAAAFGLFVLGSLSAGRLANKFSLKMVVLAGVVMVALGSLIVPWIEEKAFLFVPQMMIGMGWGLTFPLLMGLSIRGLEKAKQATAMGAFQAIYGVGMLVGPLTGGLLAVSWGLDKVFYFSSVLCFIPLVIALRMPKR